MILRRSIAIVFLLKDLYSENVVNYIPFDFLMAISGRTASN